MKEIKITEYTCDYCDEQDKDKQYIEEHEAECYFNPNNETCATCRYKGEKYYSYNFEALAHKCNKHEKENCHVGVNEKCDEYEKDNLYN